jgi:hypothetical protein
VGLLIMLLFVHPHAQFSPNIRCLLKRAFSANLPILTLVSLNLFSKIAFNGFTALEQVAVFAGETRNAARSILRSAWIAAPIIALMYILMTGSILTYTPADRVDLVNPIAQVIAAAFGAPGATDGHRLGRGARPRSDPRAYFGAHRASRRLHCGDQPPADGRGLGSSAPSMVHPFAPTLPHADTLLGGNRVCRGLIQPFSHLLARARR